MNNKVVPVRMPMELYEKLMHEAKTKRISFAALIRLICSEHLDKK